MGRKLSLKMEYSIARSAKNCNNCGEYKNHVDFDIDRYNPDNRRGDCKICRHKKIYQYQLIKKKESGIRVNDCIDCGGLFMPRTFDKLKCGDCRK